MRTESFALTPNLSPWLATHPGTLGPKYRLRAPSGAGLWPYQGHGLLACPLSTSLLSWDGIAETVAGLRLSPGGALVDLACGRGGYGLEKEAVAPDSGTDLADAASARYRSAWLMGLKANDSAMRAVNVPAAA